MPPTSSPTSVSFEMTPERLAFAMASRVLRERQRLARRLREIAEQEGGHPEGWSRIDALASELERTPGPVAPLSRERADAPSEETAPLVIEEASDGLPAVHHIDDMREGIALVQGGMHRRGLTGRLHR